MAGLTKEVSGEGFQRGERKSLRLLRRASLDVIL